MNALVVNVKTYREGTGKDALELAKIMEEVGKKYDVKMIMAVQPCDIYLISREVDIDIFSQRGKEEREDQYQVDEWKRISRYL